MSASFDLYKVFYYVGKFKNITHAAAALFVSQSTVSRSIQSLESELGCRLFDRHRHGVTLTVEGEALYEHISKACEDIFLGEEKLLSRRRLSEYELKIGLGDMTMARAVFPVLRAFNQEYPYAQVNIITHGLNNINTAVEALVTNELDIFCGGIVDNSSSHGGAIEAQKILTVRDVVVASRRFSELRNRVFSLSELSSYPFAAIAVRAAASSYLDMLFPSPDRSVTPTYLVDSMEMLQSIFDYCDCVALVPSLFVKRMVAKGNCFTVNVTDPLPQLSLNILTSKDAPKSSLKDAFIKLLVRSLKTQYDNAPVRG